jgi:hypothetical protein
MAKGTGMSYWRAGCRETGTPGSGGDARKRPAKDLAGRLPYRKRGKKTRHWLSQFAAARLNDYLTRHHPPLLHAHSKDAAQQAFYKACKVAKANRHLGASYPHKRRKSSLLACEKG